MPYPPTNLSIVLVSKNSQAPLETFLYLDYIMLFKVCANLLWNAGLHSLGIHSALLCFCDVPHWDRCILCSWILLGEGKKASVAFFSRRQCVFVI